MRSSDSDLLNRIRSICRYALNAMFRRHRMNSRINEYFSYLQQTPLEFCQIFGEDTILDKNKSLKKKKCCLLHSCYNYVHREMQEPRGVKCKRILLDLLLNEQHLIFQESPCDALDSARIPQIDRYDRTMVQDSLLLMQQIQQLFIHTDTRRKNNRSHSSDTHRKQNHSHKLTNATAFHIYRYCQQQRE